MLLSLLRSSATRGLWLLAIIGVASAALLMYVSLSSLQDSTRASADIAEMKSLATDVALASDRARLEQDSQLIESAIEDAEVQAREITEFVLDVLGSGDGAAYIGEVRSSWFAGADAAREYAAGEGSWEAVILTSANTRAKVDEILLALATRREAKTGQVQVILGVTFALMTVGAGLALFGFIRARRRAVLAQRRGREQAQQIQTLLDGDPLTGLPNGSAFRRQLESELNTRTSADGFMGRVAVLSINIDRFRRVNDSSGYRTGDALLCAFADQVKVLLPAAAILARQSSDQFLLSVPEWGAVEAEGLAIELSNQLETPFELAGLSILCTASVGFSSAPQHGIEADALISASEAALSQVKKGGGQSFGEFKETLAISGESLQLEDSLRQALVRDEFLLVYQPIVKPNNGHVEGVEALLRWQVPGQDLLQPSAFMASLEDTGFIVPVGEWVVLTACRQAREWAKLGYQLTMAVNISARQLQHPELAGMIKKALDETLLPPDALELEVTETAALRNPDLAARVLQQLRDLGVRVSLDDFGTGQSSLEHIRKIPTDTLKIDRSFVDDMMEDSRSDAIVSGVIRMAHSLGWKVVAEGVETADQLEHLATNGCDKVQGFFISTPLSAHELVEFVRYQELVRTA